MKTVRVSLKIVIDHTLEVQAETLEEATDMAYRDAFDYAIYTVENELKMEIEEI